MEIDTNLKCYFKKNYAFCLLSFLSLVLMSGLPPGGQELQAHMKTTIFAT